MTARRAWVWALALAATGSGQTGDPLAAARRVQGQVAVAANGALETVMLLAQLSTPGPPRNEFQARVRQKYGLYASHPAVQETAALLEKGWTYTELARFATLMNSAPYFVLSDSPELEELASLLPESKDRSFNLDRLHGFAKLVREFYWDHHVGRFLRATAAAYQQAVRQPLTEDVGPGSRVLVTLVAPVERLEFTRQALAPAPHVVLLGSSELLPSAEPERGPPPSHSTRRSRPRPRPR
jgi:hypothetical protein